MSFLYIVDDGSKISIDGGVVKIVHKDGEITKVPKETIESIAIFGNSQMTTQCTKFCLERGIRVSYFSKNGAYFGCLLSVGHINIKRLKKQIFLSEQENFYYEEETRTCMLDKKGMRIFLRKFESKLHSEARYLTEFEGRMSFRRAIWHQVANLVKAIENEDVQKYVPIRIR